MNRQETEELMTWARGYLRKHERQKQESALEQHFRAEFAALNAEERRAQWAELGLQVIYASPCAILVIGGFWLAATAAGGRESWSNSFTTLLGLVLVFAGILCGVACGHATTHSSGLFKGVHHWRESIQSRRAVLREEYQRELKALK